MDDTLNIHTPRKTYLSWFAINWTSEFLVTFHLLFKANSLWNDDIISMWITQLQSAYKNWWNIDEFPKCFFQCCFYVGKLPAWGNTCSHFQFVAWYHFFSLEIYFKLNMKFELLFIQCNFKVVPTWRSHIEVSLTAKITTIVILAISIILGSHINIWITPVALWEFYNKAKSFEQKQLIYS